MIRLLLFRFWPVFLPWIVYAIWHRVAVGRAKKEGKPVPHFRDGPIYWLVISSLVLAVLSFIVLGAEIEPHKGDYTPPVMENGKITPGQVHE